MLFLNGQKQLKLGRQLLLTIESIWKVYSSDPAVSVYSHSKGLNVIWSIGSPCEIGKVELNLVPAFIQPHGHCAYKRFHSCCWLIIWSSESTPHILVVQDLYFEGEIFFKLNNEALTFLIIITKKGSLMPNVYYWFTGHVM